MHKTVALLNIRCESHWASGAFLLKNWVWWNHWTWAAPSNELHSRFLRRLTGERISAVLQGQLRASICPNLGMEHLKMHLCVVSLFNWHRFKMAITQQIS